MRVTAVWRADVTGLKEMEIRVREAMWSLRRDLGVELFVEVPTCRRSALFFPRG